MKKIKITWVDAIIYGANSRMPSDISYMETVGILEKEEEGWMIIKDPVTINTITGKPHPQNLQPTYYCIPTKAVKTITEIN